MQLKSSIQSIWNGFKFIKFDNGQEGQADKPVRDKDTMIYMENIPIDVDNNCQPFRHNMDNA